MQDISSDKVAFQSMFDRSGHSRAQYRFGILLSALVLLALGLAGCDGSTGPIEDGSNGAVEDENDQPDPISVDPLSTDRLVGAHYYPWYEAYQGHQDWTEDAVSNPLLGEYSSTTDSVINRHVKWAREHGIRWFSMSWWGPGEPTDRVIKNHFLEARLADSIKFSILYETIGRFGSGSVDMGKSSNKNRLAEDLQYLSDTYFSRDNYLRIDGRPVLFIYIGNGYYGEVEAAFEQAFEQAGVTPYVLADVRFGAPPDVYPITQVADAVTTYNPYSARSDIEDVFHDRFASGNHVFHLSASGRDFGYVPVAIPGYNDTEIPDSQREDNPVLEASPDRYERVLRQLQPHLKEAPAALITSFNEWYENTQIEPNEQHGQRYLNLTADKLATGSVPTYQPPEGTTVTLEWGAVADEQSLNPDAPTNRQLAFSASKIRIFDSDGQVLSSYNVGSDDPLFVNGAYGPESNSSRTWRWFGGHLKTTRFQAVGVSSVSAVELEGRLVEAMDVTASTANQTTSKRLEEGKEVYRFDF